MVYLLRNGAPKLKSAIAGKANCNNTWNTPYRFNDCANEGRGKLAYSMPSAANRRVELNAKEFDEEIGMYYYGARYYEPRLGLWMSVDPISNYDPRNDDNSLKAVTSSSHSDKRNEK